VTIQTHSEYVDTAMGKTVPGVRLGSRHLSVASVEVQEALDYLEESERQRKVDRLDRDRGVSNNLSFAILGPRDLGTVNRLLYSTV